MGELSQILNGFSERQRREQEQRKSNEAIESKVRDHSIRILESVVLPALTSMAIEIREHYHHVEVKQRIKGHCYPNIELLFRPAEIDKISISASHLTFRQTEDGKLIVAKDVQRGNAFESQEIWDMADVSEAKVTQLIVDFVDSVLGQ